MIVRFDLENWMSFRDPVSFSMLATREQQHGERIPKISKYRARVLPVATIYGGNASGKTNFFKALNFAKNLIVRGTQPDAIIPVEPFRLDPACAHRPSRFRFELLINEILYEYSFAVTRKAVIEEKLVEINRSNEKVLFDRREGKANFNEELKQELFLDFAFQGTRDNQLFLTNSVSQKVNTFRPVYDWFRETLELLAPDSRFASFEQFLDDADPLYVKMNEMLGLLDTGIASLGVEFIPFENIGLSEEIRQLLAEKVNEGETVRLIADTMNEGILITRKAGELLAKKLVAYHPGTDGSKARFEIHNESDGTQRVIDLLPMFLELRDPRSTKVLVIDEVDRSLHTLLTRRLLQYYLMGCSPDSRSQLLMTTHDVLLMDQRLFRRDEMWVAERESSGVSSLTAFSDYRDVRFDKDIRKSYLQGRLGGIPRLLLHGDLPESSSAEFLPEES